MRVIRALAVAICAASSLTVIATTSALAQFGGGAGSVGGDTPTAISGASNRNLKAAQHDTGKSEVAPPPVLPGTKAASEAAAPTQSTADMTPTEALFDAINRGDLSAARDAVNRGADLGGHNLLGLMPLDLSVDLGRNDISFMLLSQRGDDGGARQAPKGGGQKGVVFSGDPAPRSAARPRVTRVMAREPAEEETVAAPRLYSGNGGTQIPAAGFLGFDGGRSVR